MPNLSKPNEEYNENHDSNNNYQNDRQGYPNQGYPNQPPNNGYYSQFPNQPSQNIYLSQSSPTKKPIGCFGGCLAVVAVILFIGIFASVIGNAISTNSPSAPSNPTVKAKTFNNNP